MNQAALAHARLAGDDYHPGKLPGKHGLEESRESGSVGVSPDQPALVKICFRLLAFQQNVNLLRQAKPLKGPLLKILDGVPLTGFPRDVLVDPNFTAGRAGHEPRRQVDSAPKSR